MNQHKQTPYFYGDKKKKKKLYTFYMHNIKVMTKKIGLPIKKTLIKYFALSNYVSNQNKKISTYQIKNQI